MGGMHVSSLPDEALLQLCSGRLTYNAPVKRRYAGNAVPHDVGDELVLDCFDFR